MTLAQDFLEMIDTIAAVIDLPAVKSVHVGPYQDQPQKSSKFGALVLEDDSVGVTYMDIDNALFELSADRSRLQLEGSSAVDVAQMYAAGPGWQRCLGMAAINAISQHVFTRCDYQFQRPDKTVEVVGIGPGDHIGMVGYFPPLVEQIGAIGARLTVIELDKKWLHRQTNLEVTLQLEKLSSCKKVICTGTTLINQTLDDVLACSVDAESFHLIGPTVGCLPDPLFKRGVTTIGGLHVDNCQRFISLWENQQRWRDAAARYMIERRQYPGLGVLLENRSNAI